METIITLTLPKPALRQSPKILAKLSNSADIFNYRLKN